MHELRQALMGCHRRSGSLFGYPDEFARPDGYVLSLFDRDAVPYRAFRLAYRDYLAAFRIWQGLKHPLRRRRYRRNKAA